MISWALMNLELLVVGVDSVAVASATAEIKCITEEVSDFGGQVWPRSM